MDFLCSIKHEKAGTKRDSLSERVQNPCTDKEFKRLEKFIRSLYQRTKQEKLTLDLQTDQGAHVQYLYAIVDSSLAYTKIGITKNIKDRLTRLQSGSPLPLKLACLFLVDTTEALKLERDIHAEFSIFRRCGEWFDVSADEVLDYIELAHPEYALPCIYDEEAFYGY